MNDTTSRIGVMATEAIDLLIDAVEQIPPERWDQPSNLEGWSLRDLVGHVTGSAAKVVTLVEDGEVWDRPSQPSRLGMRQPGGAAPRAGNAATRRPARRRPRRDADVAGR